MRSAEEAGVLQRADGRLGFAHPLLGSTVYAGATPHARRSVHRRLAELVDDLEERARHLALVASGPHPHVAGALEEAGRHARARGAPDAAAELLELARRLTPPEDDAGRPRRNVAAAEYHLGRPARDLMAEAVQLEDLAVQEGPGSQTTVFTASRTCHGLQLLWAGELDAAREVLHQELAQYERLGRYVVRGELLTYLAEVECRAGNWKLAARHAQEAYDIDVEAGWLLGLGHLLFPRALVAAHTGDVGAARSDAEEGLRHGLRNEDMLDASCNRAVLGSSSSPCRTPPR